MKREINMKKTLLFSAMVFVALALCSCGSAETSSASGSAYAPAASSAPVDEIAERLDPTAAYVCETDEYWSVIRFDPSSHLIEGVDGPPDSDNLIFFKGTYSLEGRGLTISYQFLHDSSHSTYQTSYSVRFLTDGISLTPLGYVDGIFQDGASGTKDFILSSDWTASSLHQLCALAEQAYNNGEYDQDPSPIHSLDLDKAWTFSEEVEGDSYTTTIAFFEDKSLYGMYYIPDSGFSLSMRGTYAINGNILTLDVYWSDADPPPVSYEMKINSTDSIPGFYLTVVSEDAMYYRHQQGDRFLFREDENMNAQECRDKCLQLWDMEPQ